jgi:hypothetical protein
VSENDMNKFDKDIQSRESKINDLRLKFLLCKDPTTKTIDAIISKHTETCVEAIATTFHCLPTAPILDAEDSAAFASINSQMDIGDFEQEGAIVTTSAIGYAFKNLY